MMTIRKAQRILADEGFYRDRIDGAWGPNSKAAAMAAISENEPEAVLDHYAERRLLDMERLARLFPRGDTGALITLVASEDQMQAAGLYTRRRMAHFLAQAGHETAGFRVFEENLSYSASRLTAVWPRRFPGNLAKTLAGDPVAIANHVYADRLGNGPADSGDGWRYRGRGIFQLTGRANYQRYGEKIGVDLEAEPGRAAEPGTALRIALAYWQDRRCNGAADADDIAAITRKINGGTNGLAHRQELLAEAKRVLR